MKRIILFVLIIIFIILITSVEILAIDTGEFKPVNKVSIDYIKTIKIGGKVINIIQFVGILISVIVLVLIGIKYMLGSVEERADYKKDMIPYIVGAVLLFGITAIVKMVQQIGESINNI